MENGPACSVGSLFPKCLQSVKPLGIFLVFLMADRAAWEHSQPLIAISWTFGFFLVPIVLSVGRVCRHPRELEQTHLGTGHAKFLHKVKVGLAHRRGKHVAKQHEEPGSIKAEAACALQPEAEHSPLLSLEPFLP